jgi:hypothetical protein
VFRTLAQYFPALVCQLKELQDVRRSRDSTEFFLNKYFIYVIARIELTPNPDCDRMFQTSCMIQLAYLVRIILIAIRFRFTTPVSWRCQGTFQCSLNLPTLCGVNWLVWEDHWQEHLAVGVSPRETPPSSPNVSGTSMPSAK